ncbi:MAG TPA: hypothetical protein VE690_15225 [Rhodopila sp.]|nr:hypothetical protein [Rhodopila sp.]
MSDALSLGEYADLIDGRFAVDTAKPLPAAGAGLPAFMARDRLMADAPRVALAASRDLSPRLDILETLTDPIENLMAPLGHGVAPSATRGVDGYFVVCTLPPGAPLSESKERWTDRALIDLVLRPIAQVLDTLQDYHITHRAIRLNNVFQGAPGQLVTLGAAWAAPPAFHQPAIFEPIYSAMCHSAGRGEGTTADDIYALGVLLVCLGSGKVPFAGLTDAAVVQWKLDMGSYTALTRDFMPSGLLSDLLRGMLADDPDHRPSPKLLLDTAAARGRRLIARPPRRSQRPLRVNDVAAYDSRTLAYALALDDRRSMQVLRSGVVSQWLRRDLADAALATQVEELVRARVADTHPNAMSDPLVVMQVVTIINPRMPLCWRGVLLWPDGLPALMAEAVGGVRDMMVVVEELLTTDIVSRWSSMPAREGRGASFTLPLEAFQHRHALVSHHPGSLARLFYAMNPILPCRAPQVEERWVTTMAELMQQLERTAPESDTSVIDLPLAAFIACKTDRRIEPMVSELLLTKDPGQFRIRELELLRELQARHHPGPMPRLAKWLAERIRPDLEAWRNRPRRAALATQLAETAKAGSLSRLLMLLRNPAGLAADSAGAERARAELRRIEAELRMIDDHGTVRVAYAERAGQAIAGGVGLVALIMAALWIVVP